MSNNKSDTNSVVDEMKKKAVFTDDLDTPRESAASSSSTMDESEAENLELVRKILLGDQARKAEQQQASLERHIRASVDDLNKDMQQQLSSLRQDFQALEQKTSDWRRDMLEYIDKAESQVQKDKVDRQVLAGLLRDMSQRLAEESEDSDK